MAHEYKIISELRSLRLEMVIKDKRKLPVRNKLKNLCSLVGVVVDRHQGAQLWDSTDLPDPLTKEPGHCVGVFPLDGEKRGLVASLTGTIKVGILPEISTEDKTREGLQKLTGAKSWRLVNSRHLSLRNTDT